MNLISSPSPSTYILTQLVINWTPCTLRNIIEIAHHRQINLLLASTIRIYVRAVGRSENWVGGRQKICNQRLFIANKIEGEGGKQYAIKSHLLLTKSKGGMSPKSPGSFGPIFRLVPTTTIPYYLVHLMAPSIQGLLNELDISPIIHE